MTHAAPSSPARLVAAVRLLRTVERRATPPDAQERATLAAFPGFGPPARLFPDPGTGDWASAGLARLGKELRTLLSEAELTGAKRATFSAFYTPASLVRVMWAALVRMGLPAGARVLEPGCGIGRFMALAPDGVTMLGIEAEPVSARIARLLHPAHEIRASLLERTSLPAASLDAAIGNVPFADIALRHDGQAFSLHDYGLARAVEAVRPGGIVMLLTSRYTLDKADPSARDWLAGRADLLAAVRLPAGVFKDEGTQVVADLLVLRKRPAGAAEADPSWRQTVTVEIGGQAVRLNRWLAEHRTMILGELVVGKGLHGRDELSVSTTVDPTLGLWAALAGVPAGSFLADAAVTAPCPEDTAWRVEVEQTRTQVPWLDEGSLLVARDGTILRITAGGAVPVRQADKPLRATAGKTGQRLAALIGLRDLARACLASQTGQAPETVRRLARHRLRGAWESFVKAYGPINRTSLTATAEGRTVRRMPNVAGPWRTDPDAYLVMALEDYDEESGTARPAAILRQDVVSPQPRVTHVASAAEALAVTLNERGRIDLGYMAALYGHDEATTLGELGELAYRDPATGEHVTSDAYLSGDVRAKLVAARMAAGHDATYTRNVGALEAVQPEDLLPSEIDARLGAPWIPVAHVEAFARELFATQEITLAHVPREALWSIKASYIARQRPEATADHGTDRMNGLDLLEAALNMRPVTILDEIKDGDTTRRVYNHAATVAARDKLAGIRQRFAAWVWQDQTRAEELVRCYNDRFNNLRLRTFDGSHLDFPGMSASITLRPHQKAAIWRTMVAGNTLYAHVVGAGKTWTCVAAAMKLRQIGLARKPLIAVPNHLVEQWGREARTLYPNARILVAAKEDCAQAGRKHLVARIATGDWDMVILAHSSFERIAMSTAFQETFIRARLAEYEELLTSLQADKEAGRLFVKRIEKRKAHYEQRLEELAARARKDDGLSFEDLGVDWLLVDEAHLFKNLETPTKMQGVAGIVSEVSQRAMDLLMKAQFLGLRRPGYGVTFATGTPISNSMTELYTMLRFLAPEALAARGIGHFDAWAATFGEVVEVLELAPEGGGLRGRSRFARFTNLPELLAMLTAVADVQTADMLSLPTPKLQGGKPQVIVSPMEPQQAALQAELIARFEAIRAGGVDPKDDNALALTTDGRRLALDPRLVTAEAHAPAKGKVARLSEQVLHHWRKSAAIRGTQLVFADLGVHPTDWGFCVYDEIIAALVAAGIPRQEIATVREATTDAAKAALFERVRAGRVRVLIGSTGRLGTGSNVQTRLVALHHLDAPWKPAEVEQRDGRGIRQGNINPEVAVLRYVTEGSFDGYIWQLLETKARFIAQIMRGEVSLRHAEDVAGETLSYAEVKALAAGNPAVLALSRLEADLARLRTLQRAYADDQYRIHRRMAWIKGDLEHDRQEIAALQADLATVQAARSQPLTIDGRAIGDASTAKKALLAALVRHRRTRSADSFGSWCGLSLVLESDGKETPVLKIAGACAGSIKVGALQPGALLHRIKDWIDGLPGLLAQRQGQLARHETSLAEYAARQAAPFAHAAMLARLDELRGELDLLLAASPLPDMGEAQRQERLSAAVTAYEAMRATTNAAAAGEQRQRRANVVPALVLRLPLDPAATANVPTGPVAGPMVLPAAEPEPDAPSSPDAAPTPVSATVLPFVPPASAKAPARPTPQRRRAAAGGGRQLSLF